MLIEESLTNSTLRYLKEELELLNESNLPFNWVIRCEKEHWSFRTYKLQHSCKKAAIVTISYSSFRHNHGKWCSVLFRRLIESLIAAELFGIMLYVSALHGCFHLTSIIFLIPSYQRAPYVLVFSQNIFCEKINIFCENKVSTLRCPRIARYGWEPGTDLGSAGP